MSKHFELIVASVLQLCGIIAALAAVVIMWQNYNKRKIAEAKENSTGAAAMEIIKNDHRKLTDQIADIKEDLDDIRKDNRETAREYLDTLKQLAQRFKN